MSFTIPTTEPDLIYPGTRVRWKRYFDAYKPEDGWTLKYTFIDASTAELVVTASDNGDSYHLVDESIVDTGGALWTVGKKRWQATVQDAGPTELIVVDVGRCEFKKLFSAAGGAYDARTHAEKMVDALEAMFVNKASKDQVAYALEGLSVSRLTPDQITEWLNFYRIELEREVQRERVDQGKGHRGTVEVHFT